MNFKILPVTLFALIIMCTACSQKTSRNEMDQYVFWQPGIRLNSSDYQGIENPEPLPEEELWKLVKSDDISVLLAVDCPKDEVNRGGLTEKFYAVPVFNKSLAYNFSKDSLQLQVDQLRFDLMELSVRVSKEKLTKQQNLTQNAYGLYAISLPDLTCKLRDINRVSMLRTSEVAYVRDRKEEFRYLRKRIDSLLELTTQYATTPEDIKRFINGKPLSETYREVPVRNNLNLENTIIQD